HSRPSPALALDPHQSGACLDRSPGCFLVVRRRPSAPLFPYTTLFRSMRVRLTDAGRAAAAPPPSIPSLEDLHRIWFAKLGGTPADRKSTRLNSSHVKISYAVFCLKKKHRGADHIHHRTTSSAHHPRPA